MNDERVAAPARANKAKKANKAIDARANAKTKAKGFGRKPSAKGFTDALAVVTHASPKRAPGAPVTAEEALAQCLLPIDVGDDVDEASLASKLPPGVALGCSKCRRNWRGCAACRKREGVWLPPSRAWRKRRGLDTDCAGGGGFLALPAPGDDAFVASS